MKLKDKAILFSIIAILFLVFIYYIKSILFPFITAIIIAYLLDPLADKIQKLKLSRTCSTLIILGMLFLALEILFILFLPIIYEQTSSLVATIPVYVDVFINEGYPKIYEFAKENGMNIQPDFRNYFDGKNIGDIFNFSGGIIGYVMQSGVVLVNILSLIFITPVLVFYILRDWHKMVKKIDDYLPNKYRRNIRAIFMQIDQTLSSCIHGQFNVCVILGFFYATGLTFSGLNFGFVIGLLTGFFSFIPYIGMLIGVAIALVIGLFQWGFDFVHLSIVGLIFFAGQVLEANFLTPKLVGDKVGLHPVWVIFGLFVFGILFGFVGILLALPLTAICGVLVKFILAEYKKNFVE